MPDCCDPEEYQAVFSHRFARRTAKRYRTQGLTRSERSIVGLVTAQGIRGASVLEIGGGVGALQLELLRLGASHVTNLELSTQYEAEAAQLLQAAGMTGRVHRRHLDIAADPDAVEPADVVVLHRVVCCYPDAQGLLGAAAHHARRLLVFSYPPVNPVTRIGFWSENLVRRARGSSFRTYVHPPAALRAAAERDGLRVVHQHHAWDWDVLALAR